jgi:hypothetical protein
MVENQSHFHQRLTTLGRKHAAMSHGYDMQMRRDGLIVVSTKRASARRFFPLRGVLLLAFGFFVFKAFMLSSLGVVTYNERVAKLAQGSVIEQAGGWVMQIDPATAFMAGFLEPITG